MRSVLLSVSDSSVAIAEKPESLYPYDFVCVADDGDDAILIG